MIGENERVEYKRELSDKVDVEKEAVAFLNSRMGGTIYVGVDDDGNIVGLADADSDALKIKDRLKNNISPSVLGLFDLNVKESDGRRLIPSPRCASHEFSLLGIYYSDDPATVPVKIALKSSLKTDSGRATDPVTDPVADPVGVCVSPQVQRILRALNGKALSAAELRAKIGMRHRETFRKNYIDAALAAGLVQLSDPDNPHNPYGRYGLTVEGRRILNRLAESPNP